MTKLEKLFLCANSGVVTPWRGLGEALASSFLLSNDISKKTIKKGWIKDEGTEKVLLGYRG